MKKVKGKKQSMAFYHEQGLVPAVKQAMMFAGSGGRLATMPDIVNARISTEAGSVPWETYFTTITAEYVGFGSDGRRKIIVAHGIGPMATLDGILKAYSFHFKDKSRNNRGGRISREEFLKLEKGEYGSVDIIDMDDYMKRYKYSFLEILDFKSAAKDPVLKARFGENYNQYLLRHRDIANDWLSEQKKDINFNPFIVEVRDASNCSYDIYSKRLRDKKRTLLLESPGDCVTSNNGETGEMAIAHLISTGRLCQMRHDGHYSLVLDVSAHEWSDGVRFVGIKEDAEITDIHPGVSVHSVLKEKWKKLMKPVGKMLSPSRMHVIMEMQDEQYFTQYPKNGHSMDTAQPEFRVKSFEPMGEPVSFRTKIDGYYMFVRYRMKEVEQVAPLGANAYRLFGEPQIVGDEKGDAEFHEITVLFGKAEIDFSERLMRAKKLMNDFDLLMELAD